MRKSPHQKTLFTTGHTLPNGFVYHPDFLSREEEAELLGYIEDLPFATSLYKGEYESKRRYVHFGWDFKDTKRITPLPPFLRPLSRKVAKWLDIPHKRVVEALISEYAPGAAIGWHRDNEPCEHIIGISLAGFCRLRLRPYESPRKAKSVISIPLEPRSAYLMQKAARWKYQHSISKVEELRYSITLRTLPV